MKRFLIKFGKRLIKRKPKSVIDITGTELTPGKPELCRGNGKTPDGSGGIIECCCDECDWFMLCYAKEIKKQYGYK